MPTNTCDSLLAAFGRLTDPRHPRGVRHPFSGLLALVFLGLLCGQADFAAIARWARRHRDELRGPLGVTRRHPPTPPPSAAPRRATPSPSSALAAWLAAALPGGDLTAAVNGKTGQQAKDDDGDPIHMLNVFAHGAKLCLADWPVGGDQATDPEVLKAHLDELFAAYPTLRVLTGDALFCQRPLAGAIVAAGRDYLLATKDNQPDLLEAAGMAFAEPGVPAVAAREKNGAAW